MNKKMINFYTLFIMNAIDILPKEIWFHILDYIEDYDTFDNLSLVCQLFMKYCQTNDKYTITDNGFNIIIHYSKRQVLKYCIYIDNIQIRPTFMINFTIDDITDTKFVKYNKYVMIFHADKYSIRDITSIDKNFHSLNKMYNFIQTLIKPFHINKIFEIFTKKINTIYALHDIYTNH